MKLTADAVDLGSLALTDGIGNAGVDLDEMVLAEGPQARVAYLSHGTVVVLPVTSIKPHISKNGAPSLAVTLNVEVDDDSIVIPPKSIPTKAVIPRQIPIGTARNIKVVKTIPMIIDILIILDSCYRSAL